MSDMFRKLRTEDYALLGILYDGGPREWWYLGYTISQLVDMTGISRPVLTYRLNKVLLPRNLVARESGTPSMYYGIKDYELREQIDAARKKYIAMLIGMGVV